MLFQVEHSKALRRRSSLQVREMESNMERCAYLLGEEQRPRSEWNGLPHFGCHKPLKAWVRGPGGHSQQLAQSYGPFSRDKLQFSGTKSLPSVRVI
jgi:hypothetical protein